MGRTGKGVWRWGEREIIYLSLHCHHQNDSCITMGSNESHFDVSLIVRDKVTRQCPQTTISLRKRRAETDSNRDPSAHQPYHTGLTARPYRFTKVRAGNRGCLANRELRATRPQRHLLCIQMDPGVQYTYRWTLECSTHTPKTRPSTRHDIQQRLSLIHI